MNLILLRVGLRDLPGNVGARCDDGGANGRDDIPLGNRGGRTDGSGHRLGLAARQPEEPGQNLRHVVGRHDLGELADGGQAQAALSQGGLHRGELLDELDGGLPVLGGACGEPELAAQVVEERCVAELAPQLLVVKVGEGEKEVGHGLPLLAKQGGELAGEVVSVHTPSVTSPSDNSGWGRSLRGPASTCAIIAVRPRSPLAPRACMRVGGEAGRWCARPAPPALPAVALRSRHRRRPRVSDPPPPRSVIALLRPPTDTASASRATPNAPGDLRYWARRQGRGPATPSLRRCPSRPPADTASRRDRTSAARRRPGRGCS
jgi:hypothetical protein